MEYTCIKCRSKLITKTYSTKDGLSCPMCRGLLNPTKQNESMIMHIDIDTTEFNCKLDEVKQKLEDIKKLSEEVLT